MNKFASPPLLALYLPAVICLLLVISPRAHADPLYIQLGGWSHHFDRNKKHNERHDLMGLEVELTEVDSVVFGVAASTFKNSQAVTSNYFAGVAKACKEYSRNARGCAGITGGFINGYKSENQGGYFPAIVPYASIEYRRAGIDLTCLPKLYNRSSFCAVQGKIRIQ